MATVKRFVKATPEQVWEVLADGWLYPLWVVGAARMREVDEHWPAVGSRLHHSAGTWPLLVDDTTSVRECVPGELLSLKARGWPAGEAGVVIELRPHVDGTDVTIDEDVETGPGVLVPRALRSPMMVWRNVEALRRLAYLAERRAS